MNTATADRLHPPMWDHQWYPLTRLRSLVEEFIADHGRGGHAIDLGSGDAPYRSLFERARWRYTACDIDGDPDVLIQPGRPVPLPDGTAGIVVSFQVLEHVGDLDAYLGECRRLLRPGGVMLLTTHGNWPFHPHPTDYRRWTPMGLRLELEERGFVIERLDALIGPPAWMANYALLALHELGRGRGRVVRGAIASACVAGNGLIVTADRLTPPRFRESDPSLLAVRARPS
jgi:SAM-dependent methyltransferase